MLESLEGAKEAISGYQRTFKEKDLENIGLLQCEYFWPDIKIAISLMRQLANCIAIAERSNASLSGATDALLQFAESVFSQDWNNTYYLEAAAAFLTYFSKEKLTRRCTLRMTRFFQNFFSQDLYPSKLIMVSYEFCPYYALFRKKSNMKIFQILIFEALEVTVFP